MLRKITGNKIIISAVFLLIIPMILSAAGIKETDGGKAVTLNEDVMILLEKVESGELTLDNAKEEFLSLEKEYQINTQERAQIQKMMEDVGAGDKKAEDCADQLQEQLQTRERTQDKTQDKILEKDQEKTETSSQEKDGTGNSSTGKK